MARRNKVGAMSTGEMVALGLGAAAELYFIMKPSTPTTPVVVTTNPGAAAAAANASTTNTLYNDATSVANNLLNFFN